MLVHDSGSYLSGSVWLSNAMALHRRGFSQALIEEEITWHLALMALHVH